MIMVRIVDFATFKNLGVKTTMLTRRNVRKYPWTSPNEKIHNQIYHILKDCKCYSSLLDLDLLRSLIMRLLITVCWLQKLLKNSST